MQKHTNAKGKGVCVAAFFRHKEPALKASKSTVYVRAFVCNLLRL